MHRIGRLSPALRWPSSRCGGAARCVSAAPQPGKPEERAEPPQSSNRRIFNALVSHLWSSDQPNSAALRARVVAALGLMVGSKLVTISVPFVFKELINTYSAAADIAVAQPMTSIPLALVLGYGIARSTGNGFQELRNTVFSVVAQQAIRNMARDVFRHLLHLDMQYHINKNSGTLFRTIDRGE